MKYVGLLVSSICVFLVILVNLYYNSITLDMQKIKDYVAELNIILEDVVEEQDKVNEKKDEYISRLLTLKRGIQNSKTSFLVSGYKEYKIKSIESLIYSISEKNNKQEHLDNVNKYNNLSNKALDKLVNKSFLEVTNLSTSTYI